MNFLKLILIFFLILSLALFPIGCKNAAAVDLMANVHAAERPSNPTEPGNAFVDSVGDFSWSLFQEAIKEKENTLISPASVYFALAMTMNGAGGTTRDAMLEALSAEKLSVETLNTACRDWMTLLVNAGDETDLKISNSIWYNDDFAADPAFLKANADYFSAALRQLDFADSNAANVINDWVNKATEGKIKSIMDKADDTDLMYLINAVYFKSIWKNQFSSMKTHSGEFFLKSGMTFVKYMNRESEIALLTTDDLKGVLLPFEDSRFSFVAVLPPEGSSVRDVVGSMNAVRFKELLKSSRQTTLSLHLPKFEVEYETSLLDHLTRLGMSESLQSGADFSLMVKNHSKILSITGVGHKTFFKIDENGAEAAAVTGVTMAASYKPEGKSTLVFDRPFLYGIVDTVTGLPLFLGIMDNPGSP